MKDNIIGAIRSSKNPDDEEYYALAGAPSQIIDVSAELVGDITKSNEASQKTELTIAAAEVETISEQIAKSCRTNYLETWASFGSCVFPPISEKETAPRIIKRRRFVLNRHSKPSDNTGAGESVAMDESINKLTKFSRPSFPRQAADSDITDTLQKAAEKSITIPPEVISPLKVPQHQTDDLNSCSTRDTNILQALGKQVWLAFSPTSQT